MKKILIVLSLVITGSMSGQELLNFYLEPNINGDGVVLHTTVYHFNVALFLEDSHVINGNVIDFNLCYLNHPYTSVTYDEKEFEIILPNGFSNFVFNVNLFTWDVNAQCDYSSTIDSGTILFDYPYFPTEKTFVPDNSFESFLELNEYGDDIPNNDEVFTHRFENINRLYMNGWELSSLGLDEIEVLTGIETLSRLSVLQIANNLITEFDATNHPDLTWLYTRGSPLSSLDVSNNRELRLLWTGEDTIEELDVSQNENLIQLYVNSGDLATLELRGAVSLKDIKLQGTMLTELDISQNINLEDLDCSFSLITDLDTTNNSLLKSLNCSYSSLSTILLNNEMLERINCSGTELTNIDISSCANLEVFVASNVPLSGLDIRGNAILTNMVLISNNLTSLDLRNGGNENFDPLLVIDNPNLTCVSVDDPALAPYPGMGIQVPNVIYSADCSLGTNDVEQLQTVIYPNPVQNILTIESKENIESIQIYSMLGELIASEMGVSQIDFSSYAKGVYFLKVDSKKGSVFQKVMKE